MQIEIKTDLRRFARGMTDVAKRQIPFATAQALTATAGHAGLGWQEEMVEQLDRPTPFTVKSVAVRGARKTHLVATVFIRAIASQYLEPFVNGGPHYLGAKRGLLGPRNIRLNAYGNLPKSKLASLKAKSNTFIGQVRMKNGQTINGVWQRTGPASGARVRRVGVAPKDRSPMKLLIRFADPEPVTQRLDFLGRTEAAVRDHFEAEFAKAFAMAQASAN